MVLRDSEFDVRGACAPTTYRLLSQDSSYALAFCAAGAVATGVSVLVLVAVGGGSVLVLAGGGERVMALRDESERALGKPGSSKVL